MMLWSRSSLETVYLPLPGMTELGDRHWDPCILLSYKTNPPGMFAVSPSRLLFFFLFSCA